MKLRIMNLTLLAAGLFLSSACSKVGSGDSASAPVLSADMFGASALATKYESHSSLALSATQTRTLVKMTSSGTLEDVFNIDSEVYHFITTSSHVVVSGQFTNIAASDGSAIDCYLIAFSKSANREAVKCLSQSRVGNYESNSAETNGHYDDYGIATDGSNIFFVALSLDGQKTRLMKWDGASDSAVALIEINIGESETGFNDVYVSNNSQNVCVTRPAANSFDGTLTCGAISGASFSNIDLGASFVSSTLLRIGNRLVMWDKVVDLDSLAVTTPSAHVDLPISRFQAVTVSSTEVISIAGNGCGNCLIKIDHDGNTTTIDSSTSWSKIMGSGSYIYVYGASGSSLKRMAFTDSALGATNYLGTYNMLSLDAFSLSCEGAINLLKLEGTASSGQPTVAYIDLATGNVHSASSQLPSIEHIVSL